MAVQSRAQFRIRDYMKLQLMTQQYVDDVLAHVKKTTTSIKIVELVRHYGLSVLSSELDPSVDAIIQNTPDAFAQGDTKYSIVVNCNISFAEKRFALARQLGNYLMCDKYIGDMASVSAAALDVFALCVLIPERGAREVLHHVSNKIGRSLTIQQVAYCLQKKYDVTFMMAMQRAIMLRPIWSEKSNVSQ